VDLTITARNLALTDSLEQYAQKRLAKLDRRLRKAVPVRLILRHEETKSVEARYVAEVTAALKGGVVVRGEQRASNVNAAIDGVADAIVRQIDRYKTRRIKSKRDGRGIWPCMIASSVSISVSRLNSRRIVRSSHSTMPSANWSVR